MYPFPFRSRIILWIFAIDLSWCFVEFPSFSCAAVYLLTCGWKAFLKWANLSDCITQIVSYRYMFTCNLSQYYKDLVDLHEKQLFMTSCLLSWTLWPFGKEQNFEQTEFASWGANSFFSNYSSWTNEVKHFDRATSPLNVFISHIKSHYFSVRLKNIFTRNPDSCAV